MMLTATIGGTSSMAPRQSRLKKPRPLRSLSAQEGFVDQDGVPADVVPADVVPADVVPADVVPADVVPADVVPADVVPADVVPADVVPADVVPADGVPADGVKERNQSLGSLEVDVSAACAGSQGSPVCKEIAALSSRLLSFTDNQSDSRQECTSLSLQNSSSSNSSVEQHCVSGHQDSSFEQHCVSGHRDSSSPSPTAAISASADRHRHPSINTELPVSLETCFQYTNPRPQDMNGNSNCESFHMPLEAYGCQSKFDLSDEGYATISMESSASAMGRFEFSTPIAAGTQSNRTKDQDTNQSFQPEPSVRATKAMLLTSTGDELNLIGKNFKTILHASRILLKELDAKLVKIESVQDDQLDKDETLSYVCAPEPNEAAVPDECVSGCFPQQRSWNRNWHYSKDELLLLSRSMLSHKPPSMWHVIAGTHSDCCIPATKVRKYFEPSAFHCHDGSLVVDRYRNST